MIQHYKPTIYDGPERGCPFASIAPTDPGPHTVVLVTDMLHYLDTQRGKVTTWDSLIDEIQSNLDPSYEPCTVGSQ